MACRLNACKSFNFPCCSSEGSFPSLERHSADGTAYSGRPADSGLLQALKPQWPADDCYHSCCNGETALSAPAGPSGRKAGAGALASAAKEAAKEIVRAAEDGASKASCRLQLM